MEDLTRRSSAKSFVVKIMTILIGEGVRQNLQLQLALQVFRDELAVEAAVFDEDFVGALAGYDDSTEVDAGDVGLKRRLIAHWAAIVGFVEFDAEAFDEVEVGMVAGEGEDEVSGDGHIAVGCGDRSEEHTSELQS